MTETVTGVIQSIEERQVSGGRTAYNVRVAGESYGAGLYKPKAKEGDYVKFDVEMNGRFKNIARNSLKVSKNKPPAEAVAASKAAPSAGSYDGRQDVISRQAAMNSALTFMNLLHGAEALAIPASGSKDKKEAAALALLQGYIKDFYELNTGQEYKDISPKKEEPAEEQEEDNPPFEEEDVPADNDEWA